MNDNYLVDVASIVNISGSGWQSFAENYTKKNFTTLATAIIYGLVEFPFFFSLIWENFLIWDFLRTKNSSCLTQTVSVLSLQSLFAQKREIHGPFMVQNPLLRCSEEMNYAQEDAIMLKQNSHAKQRAARNEGSIQSRTRAVEFLRRGHSFA